MRYRVPDRVAHDVVEEDSRDPTVYLLTLPDGAPMVLTGMGAWIWLLAAGGDEDVVGAIAEATGEDSATIAGEITHYLESLTQDGLLEAVAPKPRARRL